MIELVYLNTNISTKEAAELVKQGREIRKQLNKTFTDNLDSLKTNKQKLNYMSSCLPFLTMI